MEKISFTSVFKSVIIPTVFMAGIAWISIFYYTHHAMPIMITSKAVMIMILVLAISMCSLNGINHVIKSGQWKSPMSIIGAVLGIIIIGLLVSSLLGWHLPFLRFDRDSMLAAGILIAAKYILGTLVFFFSKRTA
jgi:hypothetical protein